ncbi:hypothetical protein ACFL1H_01395 [Nanoarchaeota archaeon]
MSLEKEIDYEIKNSEIDLSFKLSMYGFSAAVIGEGMQIASMKNLMDHNWMTGHLSDFGIVFQLSAVAYEITRLKFNKYISSAATIVPPIIATIHEYFPFTYENVTDHTDTALYWLGWGAALGGIKYLSSRKAKKSEVQYAN